MPKKKAGKKAAKKVAMRSDENLKRDIETLCIKYGIAHVQEELLRLARRLDDYEEELDDEMPGHEPE